MTNRTKELMLSVDEFGVTHIITGDGNLDDDHIRFVETAMEKEGATADERELIELLKTMTEDDRYEMWETLFDCSPNEHN